MANENPNPPAGDAVKPPAEGAKPDAKPAEGEKPAAGGENSGEQKPPADGAPAPKPAEANVVVVPDKYELKLPEGAPFDESDLRAIAAEAKAMQCTQEEAQALVDARVQFAQDTAAQYLKEAQADPEIGGAKFEETSQLALKARGFMAPKGSEEAAFLERVLDKTGAGNHRLMLRMFARVGRAMGEDSGGGLRNTTTQEKTPAQKMYPGMNP